MKAIGVVVFDGEIAVSDERIQIVTGCCLIIAVGNGTCCSQQPALSLVVYTLFMHASNIDIAPTLGLTVMMQHIDIRP